MIAGVLRPMLIAVLAAIVFTVAFTPRAAHRALDPDEPIAADGSLIAGRARTIYDTNPLLGAFGKPHADSDDPADFGPIIEHDKRWAEHDRISIKNLLGPLDWSRCEPKARLSLIRALRSYYDTRGRQKRLFSQSGPRGKAAIEQVWSTPLDGEIDDFVRHAVQYGILHKDDLAANAYPEFAATVAGVDELGAGCPRAP